MRSRPKVKVFLSPAVVRPGGTLVIDCNIDSKTETPVDWISMVLEGEVLTVVNKAATRIPIYGRAFRSGATTLSPGTHVQRAKFEIPEGQPASYGTYTARITYKLTVHISIPWWPDREVSFVVPVGFPEGSPPRTTPRTFATRSEGPRGTEPFLEVSLATTEIAPGDVLAGSVSLANLGGRRVRGITLAVVEREALAQPVAAVVEARRFELRLLDGAPPESEAIPFRFRVPAEATPAFTVSSFAVSTALEVRAEVAWGSDIVLSAPLRIIARSGAPHAIAERVAPVGRDRRLRVWRSVAGREGLSLDGDEERLLGSRGAVAVEIFTEQRDRDFWLAATLRYPDLGLDLAIAPRAWTDALSMNVVETGAPPEIDDKLAVHAREHAQARTAVTPDLIGLLAAFEQVTVGDASARLAMRGGAHSAENVAAFARKVLAAAEGLDALGRRVPPPAMFAADLEAWAAFASHLRGRLETGRMWIHDGTIGTDRVALGTMWARSGLLLGTTLWVAIDPPLEEVPAAPEDPALSPAARERWRELAARTRSVAITAGAIEAELEGRLPDPATASPLLDLAVLLRRALAGVRGGGPFR
jgi:hypothetical protein